MSSKIKKKALGRGLSDLGLNELLSRMTADLTSTENISQEGSMGELRELFLKDISPGKYQPRREIDDAALEELAESIRSQGVIQPIVVRPLNDTGYELIAGERRWRAAKRVGLEKIPVLIKDVPDRAAIAMALIENIQRENLNAIEEALALRRLSQEFDLTHQEIAKIVGKSRASISNLLRLLSLCDVVKTMVESKQLEMGHARALLALDDEKQQKVAEQVILKGLSVRETESYIRQLLNIAESFPVKHKDSSLIALEKTLTKKLGAKVSIKARDGSKGKIVIYYRNREQLNVILSDLERNESKGEQ